MAIGNSTSQTAPEIKADCEDPLYSKEDFLWVHQIHTLGPAGTNCERAAISWIGRKCPNAAVFLHSSLESAADAVKTGSDSVLLGVVAYPHLHSLIYSHLECLQLIDVFIFKTDYMVLASRSGAMPSYCATHPAPEKLLPPTMERKYVVNNVDAARECAAGLTDGCLTTLCAAEKHDLKIVHNFGQVPMAFTIHGPMKAVKALAGGKFHDVANLCAQENISI